VEIIKAGTNYGVTTNVILNNRVNGNAPTLAQETLDPSCPDIALAETNESLNPLSFLVI
jgi:hypothetical protein